MGADVFYCREVSTLIIAVRYDLFSLNSKQIATYNSVILIFIISADIITMRISTIGVLQFFAKKVTKDSNVWNIRLA